MRTALLMIVLAALFVLAGAAIAEMRGMVVAGLLACVANALAYAFGDRLVLRIFRAQRVDEGSAPHFHNAVRELAARAGLPMPTVYLIDAGQPNAFAIGRHKQRASIAATTGILQRLDASALRGVIAHELAHVKHGDIRSATLGAALGGAIGWLACFGRLASGREEARFQPVVGALAMLFAPFSALFARLAVTRAGDFEADRAGAAIVGDPGVLARALEEIEADARAVSLPVAEAHPASAHLMFVNPLSAVGLRRLFATHPATVERVARLRAMGS